MALSKKQLEARDSKRDLGAELLESIRQVKAGKVGNVNIVGGSIALEARQRMGLSQAQFAEALGIPKRTLQDWEQRRREPSGAAMTLLKVAAIRPDAVHEALAH